MEKKMNKFDAVKLMREIRNKLSLEIMYMTYEQERKYLDAILASGRLIKKTSK